MSISLSKFNPKKIEEMGIADSTRKIEAPKEKQELPIDKDS